MATSSNTNLKLKLLIDKKKKKVLFAEASKEFVDFLVSFMSLPLGTVSKLLKKNNIVGCMGDLYESIQALSETYLQPSKSKESILNPKAFISAIDTPLLLPSDEIASQQVYTCSNWHCHRWTDDPNTNCPNCSNEMSYLSSYVAPDATKEVAGNYRGGGFVKDVVTYMVMDNLEVKPMSLISSITLMKTFNIPDFSLLQEKEVDIGYAEVHILIWF